MRPTPAAPRPDPSRRGMLARLVAAAGGWVTAAHAALPAPEQAIVLSITGQVSAGQFSGRADFDMAMLAALPQHSFVAHPPWYETPRKFTGPLLRDILAAAGASGRHLRAIALNDYRVDIPYEDVERYPVIVARLVDDAPVAVRDKGPLLIVYAYSDVPDLATAVFYARSAWQLRTIEVR